MKQVTECCLCDLKSPSSAPSSALWREVPLLTSEGEHSSLPRRCYHGCTLLDDDGPSQKPPRMVIFGGQGVLEHSVIPLNDTWVVSLPSGVARVVVAKDGAPPTPRMHHTLARLGCGMLCVIGGCRASATDDGLFNAIDSLHLLRLEEGGAGVWERGVNRLQRAFLEEDANSAAAAAAPSAAAAKAAPTHRPAPSRAQSGRKPGPVSRPQSAPSSGGAIVRSGQNRLPPHFSAAAAGTKAHLGTKALSGAAVTQSTMAKRRLELATAHRAAEAAAAEVDESNAAALAKAKAKAQASLELLVRHSHTSSATAGARGGVIVFGGRMHSGVTASLVALYSDQQARLSSTYFLGVVPRRLSSQRRRSI